jgi:hypothetical protein
VLRKRGPDIDRFYAMSDTLVVDAAVPIADRQSLIDRVIGQYEDLMAHPKGPQKLTLWVLALIVAVGAGAFGASQTVQTSVGVAEVRCGFDVYLDGHADPAIENACRTAQASRLGVFGVAGLVVVFGLVSFAAAVVRNRTSAPARRREPRGAAGLMGPLAAAGLLAVVVGAFALQPVGAQYQQDNNAIEVSCGIDTYLYGYPDPDVRSACDRAYSGHARVLGVAAALGLGAAVVLAGILLFQSPDNRELLRRLLVMIGVVVVGIALIKMLPVAVQVRSRPTPVIVSCGVDTILAGHPEALVQSACRHEVSSNAIVGLGAAAVGVTLFLAAAVMSSGRRQRASAAMWLSGRR